MVTFIKSVNAETQTGDSLTLSMPNVARGNCVVGALVTRGDFTITAGWALLGNGSEVHNVEGTIAQTVGFLMYKATKTGAVSVTISNPSKDRVYLTLSEFSGVQSVCYSPSLCAQSDNIQTISAPPKRSGQAIFWGVHSAIWTTDNSTKWTTEPTDIVQSTLNFTNDRLSTFFDNGSGAVVRSFSIATGTYQIGIGAVIFNDFRYLISDELNFYTVTGGALQSVPIVEPLTAAQFLEYGCDTLPDGALLLSLYSPTVYMWNDSGGDARMQATATCTVPSQTVITRVEDMSDPSIKGIRNVVCDVSGGCLIAISWDDGSTYEYFDGNSWQASIDSTNGMTATVLSAITQSQWSAYLATKTSKHFKLRYIISQGDILRNTKFNYVN